MCEADTQSGTGDSQNRLEGGQRTSWPVRGGVRAEALEPHADSKIRPDK